MVSALVHAALVLVTLTCAPPIARPQAPAAPRLVVLITVDQLRPDYLVRFRPDLHGGLARLLREGAVFTTAHQDHAMTETSPGHATVGSGRNPAFTGIVRNEEGVADSTAPLLGTSGPGASPWRFRGTTLFDWIAAQHPQARALSVSRKDRGAILPIGRSRQSVFWFSRGQFTTSRYYADSLPSWVREFNARQRSIWNPGRVWELLLPPNRYPEPDSEPYENAGREFVFPHRAPEDSAISVQTLAVAPWMDSLTLALALEGLHRLELGLGPATDVLGIGLSATDNIGHSFGPNSREIHDQVLRLDRALGVFLDSLFRLRDRRGIVIALTADHGVTPFPEYSRQRGDPAAQHVEFDSLAGATRQALGARAGAGNWIRYFELGLLVMDRPGLEARGVNVDSVADAFAAAVRRSPAVQRADTRRTLAMADTATDWIARRWRNTLPPDLHGEVMVTLKPHMNWGSRGIAEHGQPTDDDTHVPLILFGPGVRRGTYRDRVSVVDLAPTVAQLIGVRPTEWVQGRVLTEALR